MSAVVALEALQGRAQAPSLRERAETLAFDAAVRAYSSVVGALPVARPERYGIEVTRDVSYGDDAEHMLDVYRPTGARATGAPLLYVHGGGFSRLSRQVYWIAALSLARRGFTVFTIDHRRAPEHRYPAAHEDVASAALWVRANAGSFGADASKLVLAGDSSGANLVAALATATAVRAHEPWARAVFDAQLAIRGVAVTCGFLEVSDVSRYVDGAPGASLTDSVKRSIAAVSRDVRAPAHMRGTLLDPLVVLERAARDRSERGVALARALPPFYVGVGDRDPVADDSARLARALRALDVPVAERVYAGGVHGFHYLFPWHRRSIRCWSAQARFLRNCASRARTELV